MKLSIIVAATAAGLVAGSAVAQPVGEYPPKSTIICLDVAGRIVPAQCQVPASRIDKSENICLCPGSGERIIVPICPAGVKPPPDSAAYERARHAAITNGSLMGAKWQGQPMCVAGRNPMTGS